MINHQLICKVLGQLLFLEAVLLMVSLGVSIGYQEDDVFAFLVTIFITIGAGLALKWRGHNADNSMSRRDAYLVVSLAWIVFSFFGTFPFLISGYIHSFTDAYFETMSGFTTTGATILDDVECFPHGLLFWRSLTQWIGGLGIVFFTIALLPSLVGGVCRRGYGSYQDQAASPSFHFGKMDMEYLSGAHHRLHRILLCGRNEPLRQFQLCDDHYCYRWFLYS